MNEQTDKRGNPDYPKNIRLLMEDIAELGALVFVSRHYSHFTQEATDYIKENSPVATELFAKDSGLLRKLSLLEFEQARELILSEISLDINLK